MKLSVLVRGYPSLSLISIRCKPRCENNLGETVICPGDVTVEIADGKAILVPLKVSYTVTVIGFPSRSAYAKGIVICLLSATILLGNGIRGDEM